MTGLGTRQAIYRETVRLPGWVLLVILAIFLACGSGYLSGRGAVASEAPGMTWLWDLFWGFSLAVPLLALLLLGRLQLLVRDGSLCVRFGFVAMQVKEIPLSTIERAEVVRYAPIRQFGGWGLRKGMHEGAPTAVYSLRGSSGVLLTLAQPIPTFFLRTDKVLVGSENPARLAEVLGGG